MELIVLLDQKADRVILQKQTSNFTQNTCLNTLQYRRATIH